MTATLNTSQFNQNTIRTITVNGNPYFVAVDVCRVLSIKNASRSVRRLPSDKRMLAAIETTAIHLLTLSGLCALASAIPSPVAKDFQRWAQAGC